MKIEESKQPPPAEREAWLHQNPEWQALMREATAPSVYFHAPERESHKISKRAAGESRPSEPKGR